MINFNQSNVQCICLIAVFNMSNIINLPTAISQTHDYQNDARFQGLTKSVRIEASDYQVLLNQAGVVAVRTYFAIDNGILTTVVVGVDSTGEDITQGVILGDALPCPFICPINSPL